MKSFKQFLDDTENHEDVSSWTRIPKVILSDKNLTHTEKILWMALCSFQYTSKNAIFPSRKRLAWILKVENETYVSRLTRRLQDKGYLDKKEEQGTGRIYYTPCFENKPKEDPFMDSFHPKPFRPSKHNRNLSGDG